MRRTGADKWNAHDLFDKFAKEANLEPKEGIYYEEPYQVVLSGGKTSEPNTVVWEADADNAYYNPESNQNGRIIYQNKVKGITQRPKENQTVQIHMGGGQNYGGKVLSTTD